MDAKVISASKNEVNISMTPADIGTLYIVQHEILNSSDVEFAGVIVKYPLTNECWMQVNSKSRSPMQEISKATDSAIKKAEELKKLFNSNIQVS